MFIWVIDGKEVFRDMHAPDTSKSTCLSSNIAYLGSLFMYPKWMCNGTKQTGGEIGTWILLWSPIGCRGYIPSSGRARLAWWQSTDICRLSSDFEDHAIPGKLF